MTPWTIACQAPLSMGFPRQEYWSELTFPSPGNLSNSGTEPESPALAGGFFLPLSHQGSPLESLSHLYFHLMTKLLKLERKFVISENLE